jgi:hypothetical protein
MNLYRAASFLAKAGRTSDVKGRPVKSLQEVKTYDPNTNKAKKKAAFLEAFGKSGSIAISARCAGIDRTTHYEWLAKDAKYRAEFEMKVLMATDALKGQLFHLAVEGVFKPCIYKGKYCYESRIRTICQLADGTSAFQDELPKGAKVTASREVEVHDGAMIGRTKQSSRALGKLLDIMLPEEFGNTGRPVRKPRPTKSKLGSAWRTSF